MRVLVAEDHERLATAVANGLRRYGMVVDVARLIEALLTLASSESGLDQRERVDLSVIARTVLRDGRDTDRLGLHLDMVIASAPVDGDPRLLESLVANLVENAIRHNVAGGQVHVSTYSKDGKAVLAITNTGPLIAPAQVDRLLQPFQRLDPRRSHHKDGHGLGLSIVRAIAVAHAATLSIRPGPEGGLAVVVRFPASQSPGSHEAAPLPALPSGKPD